MNLLPDLVAADPAAPAAPYLGGKRNLAKRLIDRIAGIPHHLYVEPFVGMGGVFLRRPFRARAEVINDVSRDVTNLFRILQRHYVPLMDMLRWQITSRADFERLQAARPETLTDLERAVRTLYLQRLAYGGHVSRRNFGVDASGPARFDVTKLGPALDAIRERMTSVVIECLPYDQLIERYDRPDALFYLDPPYWGCECDYGADVFAREDFTRLAEQLGRLKGRFILSLNDHLGVREVFSSFSIETVSTTYGVASGAQRVSEVIITG